MRKERVSSGLATTRCSSNLFQNGICKPYLARVVNDGVPLDQRRRYPVRLSPRKRKPDHSSALKGLTGAVIPVEALLAVALAALWEVALLALVG